MIELFCSVDEASSLGIKRRSTRSLSDVELDPIGITTPKRRRHGSVANSCTSVTPGPQWGECEERVYSAELTVYDRMQHCLLLDGDYDVVMHEQLPHIKQEADNTVQAQTKSTSKNLTWETGVDGKVREIYGFKQNEITKQLTC